MNRIKQPLADIAARAVFFPRATRALCSKNKVLVKVLKEIFQRGGSYVRINILRNTVEKGTGLWEN